MRRRRWAGLALASAGALTGCGEATLPVAGDWRPLYTQAYVAAVREAQGDPRGAAEAFAQAAALSPAEPLWRVAEGEAWIDAGAVARGLVTLRAAADAAELDPTPRLRLAQAIWFATGNRAVAAQELATAAAAFPADWRVVEAWAGLLTLWEGPHAAARRWEAAEADLAAPDLARWRAGLAWTDAGVPSRALRAWLRIEQPDATARARIARAALEAGKLDQALAYSSPADPDLGGRRVHAQVLERTRRWADAAAAWEAVLDLAPEDMQAHLHLGRIFLLELEDVRQAERRIPLAVLIARRRDTPGGRWQQEALHLNGLLAERLGDWDGAIACYRERYRLAPSPQAAGRLGRAWWRGRANAAQAIPLLEAATAAIPSPELWWCLAEAHRAQRAWADARSAYRAAAAAGRPQAEVDAALAALPPE
ncbi:MAG: tetratricopeptide repeat protein [Planctomycetota bacterium]|jgi:tetratricopeptide (TPR) repeat protein